MTDRKKIIVYELPSKHVKIEIEHESPDQYAELTYKELHLTAVLKYLEEAMRELASIKGQITSGQLRS